MAVNMKAITRNQVHVETRIHRVVNDSAITVRKTPAEKLVAKLFFMSRAFLPFLFIYIQTYKNIHKIMNNIKYSLYLCSRKKEVPP